ncbi:MAG: hypothetical protein N4A53_07155 [Pelagimonas sp.]|nr:hypothetical protein [Pelagimonas sp.]
MSSAVSPRPTRPARYTYDAFGARELEAGAELMDVGFTGRQ